MEEEGMREGLIRLLAHWGHSDEELEQPERTFRKLADEMQNLVVARTPVLSDQQVKLLKLFPPLRGMTDDAVRAALAAGEVVLAANFSLYAALTGEGLRQCGLEVALRPISEEEKALVLIDCGAAE